MSATAGGSDRTSFGRFEMLSELGSGAMGTVYRALDPASGREGARKFLVENKDIAGEIQTAIMRNQGSLDQAALNAATTEPATPAAGEA